MGTRKTVADIMTREVVTLLEEDNLDSVRTQLARYRFHHLPVVDGNKLVGMFTQRDMLQATVAGMDSSPAARAREARFLEQTFVRDVMKTTVKTVAPGDTLQEAARRMLQAHIGALPVVNEQNELLGIVTENDIVRTVAQGE